MVVSILTDNSADRRPIVCAAGATRHAIAQRGLISVARRCTAELLLLALVRRTAFGERLRSTSQLRQFQRMRKHLGHCAVRLTVEGLMLYYGPT